MKGERLSSEQIVGAIRDACGAEAILSAECREWPEGTKGVRSRSIWIRVARPRFKMALRALADIDYPHLGVISGCDLGESIELLYHLYVYYGTRHAEILVTLAVAVPKDDPTIPTITDLIPGALTSEREKQEMLGVIVTGIPDGRRMFLPPDFPAEVYPWRRDEKGLPEDMIKQLWHVGRSEELRDQKPLKPAPVAPTEKGQVDAGA